MAFVRELNWKCEWTGTAQQGLFRVASMKLRCCIRADLHVLRRFGVEELQNAHSLSLTWRADCEKNNIGKGK